MALCARLVFAAGFSGFVFDPILSRTISNIAFDDRSYAPTSFVASPLLWFQHEPSFSSGRAKTRSQFD